MLDVLVGVPSDCSGRFVGCQLMPAALRSAGIVEVLGVEDAGNLQVVMADPIRDPESGVIGIRDLLNLSAVVRDALQGLLSRGRRPLVIGGDCTVLIGVAAALARTHAEAGLLFVDGHLDCYDGASSPSGEGADMELAILLGRGPRPLLDFGERVPAFRDDRVVVLGPMDEAEAAGLGAPNPRLFAPNTRIVDGDALASDPGGHAATAVAALDSTSAGFWLHVDLDVLSSDELPAVDYPDPRGLTFDQLRDVLSVAAHSPRLLGASIVILNPTKDPTGGDSAARVVALLRDALR